MVGIYGKRQTVKKKYKVTKISIETFIYLFICVILGGYIIGNVANIFDLQLDYIGAYYIVLVFCAEWMIVKKKIEGWLLWLLVDGFYLPIYYCKGFYIYFFFQLLYLICYYYAYNTWKKSLNTT